MTIFFLGSEGDQVFVVLGMLLPEIGTVVTDSDILVMMQKQEEVFLPRVNRQSEERCQEGTSTEDGTFANCVIDRLRQGFQNRSCAPIVVHKFLDPTMQLCEEEEENLDASKAALNIISNEVNSRSKATCKWECTRVYPTVKPIRMTVGKTKVTQLL